MIIFDNLIVHITEVMLNCFFSISVDTSKNPMYMSNRRCSIAKVTKKELYLRIQGRSRGVDHSKGIQYRRGNRNLSIECSVLCRWKLQLGSDHPLFPGSDGKNHGHLQQREHEPIQPGGKKHFQEPNQRPIRPRPQASADPFHGQRLSKKKAFPAAKCRGIDPGPRQPGALASRDASRPYRRLAGQTGIAENVLFIGHQTHPEALYGVSDVFILPMRYDAFANVCLEAMACGTKVITTRSNGAAKIISSHNEGYVLKSWQAEELAARIQAALHGNNHRIMGKRSARRAASFTMDGYLQSILSLYEQMQKAKRP
jgi:hypothetical protein